MRDQEKFEFEIESFEEGEPLDPASVRIFERYLNDLLDHADFGFRISSVRMVQS